MRLPAKWITIPALLALILPVCCLIIGSNYDADTSPCGFGQGYTISLGTFLNVAGYVSIICIVCMVLSQMGIEHANATRNGKWRYWNAIFNFVGSLWLLFLVIWSVIGFYIYLNQMSYECRKERVGIMIFACCILMSIFGGFSVCCLVCACYISANWERDTFYTY